MPDSNADKSLLDFQISGEFQFLSFLFKYIKGI